MYYILSDKYYIKIGGYERMGLAKNIKKCLIDKDMKVSDLAGLLDTDVKALSVKLSRDSLSYKSIESIAEALDCDIKLVDKKTNIIY